MTYPRKVTFCLLTTFSSLTNQYKSICQKSKRESSRLALSRLNFYYLYQSSIWRITHTPTSRQK
jgi:hypothetical protein